MIEAKRYDVAVIGIGTGTGIVIGAGGGALAHRLAPTGKRVLSLERGDTQPKA